MKQMKRGTIEIQYRATAENRKATKQFLNNNRYGKQTKYGDFRFRNEYVLIEGVFTIEKLQ